MDDHPQSVAPRTLSCAECERCWSDRMARWRAYVTDDDPPEVVFYCEDCAEREFG